jgi:hypothetical protein
VISLRIFVLLLGGLIVVLGSDRIGMGGAGPLAVIVAAFFASAAWINKGWRVGEVSKILNTDILPNELSCIIITIESSGANVWCHLAVL